MYKLNKPCPGCGKPGHEEPRYSAEDLCFKCRDLLKLGRNTQEANKLHTDYVTLTVYPFWVAETNQCRAFFKQLAEFCNSIQDVSKETKDHIYIGSHDSSYFTVRVTKVQAEAIKNLYTTVKEAFKDIEQKGKEQGAKLLIGLNNGSITLNKFDEQLKPNR